MPPPRQDRDPDERLAQRREPGPGARPRGGVLRRWPPVLWLPVYVGSIFILNGARESARFKR